MEKSVYILPLLTGMLGVFLGGLLVYLVLDAQERRFYKRQTARKEIQEKHQTRQILILLNGKINEIMMKRQKGITKDVGFDGFSDLFIDIEDYVYLQSFIAQNYDYLPDFVREKFLKEISARKVILTPDETVEMGGYAFKGGRIMMERLSEDLLRTIEENI